MISEVQGRARTPFDAALSLDTLKRGESYILRVYVANDRSRFDGVRVRFTLANTALRVAPACSAAQPEPTRYLRLNEAVLHSADVLAEQHGAELLQPRRRLVERVSFRVTPAPTALRGRRCLKGPSGPGLMLVSRCSERMRQATWALAT